MVEYGHTLPKDDIQNRNVFEGVPLSIVDFGFVTEFTKISVDGNNKLQAKHRPQERVKIFRGNLMFSSPNSFLFLTTSRRDDLLSLCYMLVYLLNEGRIPKVELDEALETNDNYRKICEAKAGHTLKDLCNENNGTADLFGFFQECFSYQYEDEPRYGKLR